MSAGNEAFSRPSNSLPTGSVTFFFTDIEGSTRLLRELGEGYRAAQDDHTRLLREAIAEGGGTEVRTEGDSFFVVFSSALDALTTAIGGQRRLASHSWPDGRPLRVRMGMHSGEGRIGGDDYIGMDVNLAARIAAATHGGQIVVSEATRGLVRDHLPKGHGLQLLGAFRLKDFPGSERLYQLEIPGLPSTFPPLRALNVRRAHLPPEATTFIGRVEELSALARLIAERRLITLTGPGGIGKSRIALRATADVAERFDDGAYFVPAAAVRDGELLPATIASALDLPDDGANPPEVVLREWVEERRLLLVLDNLEQVEGAGTVVHDLLTHAPGLRVLATSRSPLNVTGEQEFSVAPLPVPKPNLDSTVLERSDAIRLFIDRARLVRRDASFSPDDFAVIADIAAQLDGLPLAIELAAARVRILSVAAIRDRLVHRLDALAHGPSTAPRRQQSVREAIAWSHDLLDEQQRDLFRRLAVFVGGWTFQSAEAIAGGSPVLDVESTLEALVSHSLVQTIPNDQEPRFSMLQTIADFSWELLARSGEQSELQRRHAAFFRELAEDPASHSLGPERSAWLDRLENDIDNVRAAIDRSAGSNLPDALGIAAALRPFWLERNHGGEGLRNLIALIGRADVPAGREFAHATAAAAAIATWLGDYGTARRTGRLGVTAYRDLGDRAGLADAVGTLAFATIEVDAKLALELNSESLLTYRALSDGRGEGQALLGRATIQFAMGRLHETRDSLEKSLELLRRSGDHYFALFTTIFLGRIELLVNDIDQGLDHYREVLERARAIDLRIAIAIALDYLGEVAVWGGDLRRAVRLGAAAERLKEQVGGGIPPRMGGALEPLPIGKRHLSPAEFDVELAKGRAMDLESAIAEALATPAPSFVPSPTNPEVEETSHRPAP